MVWLCGLGFGLWLLGLALVCGLGFGLWLLGLWFDLWFVL